MTPRERLLTVLSGEVPDCVPVMPDTSNMIPARLTGRPFWDLYLYHDPPIWEAYVACAKHFDFDSLMDGYFPLRFPEERPPGEPAERFIVQRRPDRIVVQDSWGEGRRRRWGENVTVYRLADPPVALRPQRIGLAPVPRWFEPVEGVKEFDRGPAGFARAKAMLGEQGLLGAFVTGTVAFGSAEDVYRYYDHPEQHERWAQQRVEAAERRYQRILAMDVRPDFLCVGGSGTLVFQTLEMFRKVAFPAVRRVVERATADGFPTHVHSCGPQAELVKIFAEETELTVIDPLEGPPMGDCDLGKLKKLYGRKIVLKGNLHTTDVMLRGSADDVAAASRAAIDAAAGGGRFILSTGDQCGRDTPDENLRAMVETARTYGRY